MADEFYADSHSNSTVLDPFLHILFVAEILDIQMETDPIESIQVFVEVLLQNGKRHRPMECSVGDVN